MTRPLLFRLLAPAAIFAISLPAVAVQSVVDGFDPNINGTVRATAILSGGKILVGGEFSQAGTLSRPRLARLNWDGTVDSTLTPPAPDRTVRTLLALADGSAYVGGEFTTLGSQPRSSLAKLSSIGTLDPNFHPVIDGPVNCLLAEPGGAVLVGGAFSTVNGEPRSGLARIFFDGSLDPDFHPVLTAAGGARVNAITRQPDGKLLLAGAFATLDGAPAVNIARLHYNYLRDAGFNGSSNAEIFSLGLQSDGRILIGGDFGQASGNAAVRFARLNANGSFHAAGPSFGDRVNAITLQPDGKVIVGGRFAASGGVPAFLRRLKSDLTVDSGYQPGAGAEVFSCTLQSDGHLMAGGAFITFDGLTRRGLARADSTGEVDATWNVVADQGPNGLVYSVVQQPDEKLMIGGNYGSFARLVRYSMARVNQNGVVDTSFANPGLDSNVLEIQVRRDAKVVALGSSTMGGTQVRRGIARFNPDGTPDSFNANALGLNPMYVTSLLDQPGGQIILSGTFTTLSGVARRDLGRVNDLGVLDASYNPGSDGPFEDMIRLPGTGEVIIQGSFATVGGVRRPYLQKLTADGVPVDSFNPAPDRPLTGIHLLPDNKILAFGTFANIGGQAKRSLARLSTAGVAEAGFGVTVDGDIFSVQVQADSSMYLMGPFNNVNGQSRPSLARLLPSGALDTTLPAVFTSGVRPRGSIIQQDGKLLLYGDFSTVAGVNRWRLARFSAPGPAIQTLSYTPTGSRIQWQRSGSSPEMERVWFSYSTDGASYTGEREGNRMSGGWDSGSIDLPARTPLWIRAQGQVPTYAGGSSGGLLESVRQIYLDGEIDVLASGRSLISGAEPTFDYGRTIQNTPASKSFTIVNRGTASMQLNPPVAPAGYTVTGIPTSMSLAPGQELTLTVALTSTTPGIHSGDLHIPSNDADEGDFVLSLSGEVYIPDPVFLVTSTQTVLQRQTGLREQTIQISNPTTAIVPAYRVIISGLPEGVVVFNASATLPDGSYVIEVLQPLGPFSNSNLILQYYSPNRQPAVISPQVRTEVILNPPQTPQGAVMLRSLRQADGSFLMEFATTPGQEYAVEYSADGRSWQASPLPIRAAGSRLQWIDRGPPVTEHPAAATATRFYRVNALGD